MEDNFDEETDALDPSEELARLAQETIDAQASDADANAQIVRTRCKRVLELYAQNAVRDADDYFHAALVLLYGEGAHHYRMSRQFAKRSAELEDPRAWALQAMAWDRWLLATGRPQRFGTQIVRLDGQWTLGEVDEQVNDIERAFYGVPPLFFQQQRVHQLRQREGDPETD